MAAEIILTGPVGRILWSVNPEHWKQGTWLALSQIDQLKNAPIGFENDHL